MPDDLDLMQLAASGDLLATVDDTDYRRVSVVFAWPRDGVPTVYCAAADWAHTPAARLSELLRANAELAALAESNAGEVVRLASRVAQLESQLRTVPPVSNQAAQFRMQAAYPAGAPPEPIPDPIICPDCDKGGWKSPRALQMHQKRAHQGMKTAQQQSKQFVEELGWRCAAKGCTGAHARDLHDTAFCTLHAQRQLTNGHETAA